MHPYQDLCHLLYEYKQASDALDDDGALKIAMQIRQAAHQLVVQAAKNVQPPADPQQAEVERLSLDGIHSCHSECQRPLCKLTRERDALLEACRFYASMMGRRKSDGEPFYMTALDLDCGDRARAAIAKAEENT